METEKIIQQLGLNEREAKIYLATLELGGETIKRIAEKASLERTGTYYLIEGLIEKGLMSRSFRGKRKIYLASEPKKLVGLEEERLKNLKEILPNLEAITNLKKPKPNIRCYEGKEGLRELYEDTLNTLKKLPEKDRELLVYAAAESVYALFPEHTKEFIEKRIRYKIRIRWIAPDTDFAKTFLKDRKEALRELRIVQQDKFKFETEMDIYAGKIALYGLKEDLIGVIIEHPAIAKTQREIFNLAWEAADRYSKK